MEQTAGQGEAGTAAAGAASTSKQVLVRKRDGRTVPFDGTRIETAIARAFAADRQISSPEQLSAEYLADIRMLSNAVVERFLDVALSGVPLEIENIQDAVEQELMQHGHHTVARKYIVYREERKRARLLQKEEAPSDRLTGTPIQLRMEDGRLEKLDLDGLRTRVEEACRDLESTCSASMVLEELMQSIYDGITPDELEKALIFSARSHIEKSPSYSLVTSRLLLGRIYEEVLGTQPSLDQLKEAHRKNFKAYIVKGIAAERLDEALLDFDIEALADALLPERDRDFQYLGLQTLYDRYLLQSEGRRIETPQFFFMRVAMGLCLLEGKQKNETAVSFYNLLSSFRFMSSTPTLFNAGTRHPQLSSCYLSTIEDDLEHIFKVLSDDAKLSKWAGGLGNDWTNVRATGSHIKGTDGRSQGIVPFLKVANDTAVAVNQGGKRKGAMCAYLETWHLDIEDFLELRKNTGDERRRTHDMNTANWIPDLFMKRVKENRSWTLFSPSETPDLHDLYGKAFETRYEAYEAKAERGEIKQFKKIEAMQLWRKMLTMLFETGHPWITFKDPSNIRSPQDHCGVVHSSNLCTEILLNTSSSETAVCNLGSINLALHTTKDGLDQERLRDTIQVAMRMLDNVVNINYYPTTETRHANLQHRPVGLGIMGFQDALYIQDISYASDEAVTFADQSMEMISYHTLLASSELAKERGAYDSFKGSKWDRGMLPIDSLAALREEREGHLDVDTSSSLDWAPVRAAIRKHGLRNSNTMAIAPTATISNICGVSQSIEPTYKNLFVKSNLSGEFTYVNRYLYRDLKDRGLWDEQMLDDLKYFDGSVQEIERVPDDLKAKYITAFDLEPDWLIECASRRQKWMDMGQSLNLYIAEPSGKKLSEMYITAWEKGLKTTYYLRALGATQVEKSTLDVNRRGIQPRWMKNRSASSNIQVERQAPKACSIDDPDCEACQ